MREAANVKVVTKVSVEERQKRGEIPCNLKGTEICECPDKCDGYNRLCERWKNHSSR